MLSYLELKNFLSFSDITLDLRKAYGEPKKVAFIYGENGSGKSNLLSSLLFLRQTLNTLENQIRLKDIPALRNHLVESIKDENVKEQLLQQVLRRQFFTLSDLIDDYKMLGVEQSMSLKFGFRLNHADGSYFIELSDQQIIKEELRYQINEREGVVFSLSKNETKLSPAIFSDRNYKKELLENIEKYWGKHTFMAVLFNESQTKNHTYIENRLNGNILEVMDWLKKLSVWCKQCKGETAMISLPLDFLQQLESGSVKTRNNEELKVCEATLNTFFTQLYSDIKSAYYVLTPEDNRFSYELYFKKQIAGKLIDIPISRESTGTQKLLEIFPMLFSSFIGASVFIDEIDSGIHDLLMQNVLGQLDDSLEGQFIATTHNTLLMENLQPESTYIIRVNADGNKTVDCVAEYKVRTQKNNNIRNKYLRGDYDGIPHSGYLDLQELVEDTMENILSSVFTGKEGGEG